jgi:hypothetical protein
VAGPEFTIVFPARMGNDELDHYVAFPYIRGMATLALTEDGWEVEGGGGPDWAHWVKGKKFIYVRGFGPPADRRIPFHGQGDVTQQELDVLADRLIKASGWTLERNAS